jgi:hypothetical protein
MLHRRNRYVPARFAIVRSCRRRPPIHLDTDTGCIPFRKRLRLLRDGRNLAQIRLHRLLLDLDLALEVLRCGIPVLRHGGEPDRGVGRRFLNHTHRTALVGAVGAGPAIIHKYIGDGQLGIEIVGIVLVVDQFLDL